MPAREHGETKEWVVLARIHRARGIRGEVQAESLGSPLERFTEGLSVALVGNGSERPAVLESAWEHNGTLILSFSGVDTRTEAEQLRGCDVCIPETERPPAPEGEYYVSDLVGCRVETLDGRVLGDVTAWHEYGAAPLLEVRQGSNEILVPFIDAIYRTVDITNRRIVVELPEGLEDLNRK